MTDADATKAALTLEADVLHRAGQMTLTQAKSHMRDGRASPVALLALQQTQAVGRLTAALTELLRVCVAMDAEHDDQRPTEDEYQAAMRQAEGALKQP